MTAKFADHPSVGPHTVVIHPGVPTGTEIELRRLSAELGNLEVIAPQTAEGVLQALEAGAEILTTQVWDAAFLGPDLEWVAAQGAGFDQYPVEQLNQRGVVLTTGRGVHAGACAEHALGLLLAMARGIAAGVRSSAAGRWDRQTTAVEIAGMTLGVLGLGAIGEEVAKRASNLGLEVVGLKSNPNDYVGVAKRVYGPGQLLELCKVSDALVVALPNSPTTRKLVGAEELDALGNGWIVNVGRGSAIDEEALVAALRARTIRGAGLDVFETEPLSPHSALWSLENAVLTPHIAGITQNHSKRWIVQFDANLRAFRGESTGWVNRVT